MTKEQVLLAEIADAQREEASARSPLAKMQAKSKQTEAMDALSALHEETRLGKSEETVVLIAPNPQANATDANGVEFVDGKAEGVPKSLAEEYVRDLGAGYRIA